MAEDARVGIFKRRGVGIADLSASSTTTGDLTLDQADAAGVWHVNSTHQIGIATQTEVGLSYARFPVRVIICAAGTAANVPGDVVASCASYWRLANAADLSIQFARKPIASTTVLKHIYKAVADLDERLWETYIANKAHAVVDNNTAALNTLRDTVFETFSAQAPTPEMSAAATAAVVEIINTSRAAHMIPKFKICDNVFLVGTPHGRAFGTLGTLNANKVALIETACCLVTNYKRIRARYATASEGVVFLAACSIASMFRFGFQEAHEHQEYYTILVSPSQAAANQYIIQSIRQPAGAPPPADLAVGELIDLSTLKLESKVLELANAMVMSSGLMHYLFNHTTGGTIVQGTLLTTLAMYGYIKGDTPPAAAEEITSIMYEALHPVNKRAIANIFLRNTGVVTHGRSELSPVYERFQLDAFISLRCSPYPAGSHKAFIALQAYKRILQSGLGVFLPWADQSNALINTCREVLQAGARAHIGSAYYTGEPCASQPASIDAFLPELAMYVRTFHKGDSLSMSPHMSETYAKGANANWTNLLKGLKANDVSATSIETVRKFLSTTGNVHFTFNPNDEATWGKAIDDASTALASISNIFN